MKESHRFATIMIEVDKDELEHIASTGRLEEFVDKATTLFRRDLKAELVKDGSVKTGLAMIDDDFGTVGPRGPIWYQIEKMETLTNRLGFLEKRLELDGFIERLPKGGVIIDS